MSQDDDEPRTEDPDRAAILGRRRRFIEQSLADVTDPEAEAAERMRPREQGKPVACLKVQMSGLRMAVTVAIIATPALVMCTAKACDDGESKPEPSE